LLKRILDDRRRTWEEQQLAMYKAKGQGPPKGWRERYRAAALPDTRKLPSLPDNWTYASAEQLAASEPYSFGIGPFGSNLKVSDYRAEGVPLIFVRNIRSREFDSSVSHYVTRSKANELAPHTVRPGDVLITKMGDPPGDAAVYPLTAPLAVLTADCIKLRVTELGPPARWIEFAMNSALLRQQVLRRTRGVAQKKVSLGRFRTVALPLPPLAEAGHLTTMLEEVESTVMALEQDMATASNRADVLRQAILGNAFDGTLWGVAR
jgi:type I restriction enzyme S subunit